MHHGFHRSPLAAIALAILVVLLVAGLGACGSASTTTTTAAPTTTAVASSDTTAPPTSETSTTSSTAAAPQELTVSAASSLKGALTEIGKAFDQANNSKTTFNFDASGTLQKQIEGGAPVDVFASAALKQLNALVDEKLVDPASVKNFASNEIVLLVPTDSKLGIASFQDLAKADVKKITYGDPKVAPHGVAAEEILNKLGLFDQVKPKVIYAANVSAALAYVSKGEVDAGVIFATEAKAGGDKAKIVATSDSSWHSKIVYPIGVVSASKNKTLAQALVDFVAGSEGQKILQSYGFLGAPAQ
jgi:molybdate transport system substrate-binding protein